MLLLNIIYRTGPPAVVGSVCVVFITKLIS